MAQKHSLSAESLPLAARLYTNCARGAGGDSHWEASGYFDEGINR